MDAGKYKFNKYYNELWRERIDSIDRSAPVPINHSTIENYFVVTNVDNNATPTIILPDLSAHLIMHIFTDGTVDVKIVGPRKQAIFITHKNRRQTVIIRFKPAALFGLCSISQDELVDGSFELEDILGKEISKEQMLLIFQNHSFRGLINHLLSAFEKYESNKGKIINDFLRIQKASHSSIQNTVNEMGVSSRYLQKISNELIGLSPKSISKIQRLVNSLELKTTYPKLEYSQLAVMSKYYDQSHMIDEYQQFISKTPGNIFG